MDDSPGQTEFGFVAQDVEKVFPALVLAGKDRARTLSLSCVGMIAPMVKATQELKADNDNLRKDLDELRTEMCDLKAGRAWRGSGAQ
jgi:hypothetical protein